MPIYLSVDSINTKAIKLYENEGFSITEKKETFCYMKRISPDDYGCNI
jgi:ribosomal protein S18 acetylase RimI-like enzyme